jgi:hypothetical protein
MPLTNVSHRYEIIVGDEYAGRLNKDHPRCVE